MGDQALQVSKQNAGYAEAAHQHHQRHAAEQAVASELAGKAVIYPEGFAHLLEGDFSSAAFSALVWTLSGKPHPPSPASVRRFRPLRPGTLHGVVVAPAGRFGPGWLVAREAAGAAVPAGAAVWDGRFRLYGQVEPGTTIGALGRVPGIRAFSDLPSLVLRTVPALRHGDEIIAIPHLCFPNVKVCANVQLLFEPGRPAGSAPFVHA